MTLRTGTTRSLSTTSPAGSHTTGIAITLRVGVGGVQAGLAATDRRSLCGVSHSCDLH